VNANRHSTSGTREVLALAFLVAALALLAYYPVHSYSFVNLDDSTYVYQNNRVLGPLNLSTVFWAFTHPFVLNYDPLTFLSHSLDVRLFHLNAGRHHDVNLLLHIVNSLLLFWVLRRATGSSGCSFMAAALFAVHPMNVENVAWVAERKTLLSTVFFFLALDAYREYAVKPKRSRMVVVACYYVLGLLAKPQVITLPVLLLLWDYWPLRRMFPATGSVGYNTDSREVKRPIKLRSLITEKIPLFAIAVIDAALTLIAQHQLNVQKWPYTFSVRLENAVVGYAQYLRKAVWPRHLALEYLYPGNSLSRLEVLGASLLLLLITVSVGLAWRHRYPLVGWLWFLASLLPMIGLVVQPDLESVADRYAYTSFIGLYLIVCWGVADLAQQWRPARKLLPMICGLVLLALLLSTWRQVSYWRDSGTLWAHALEVMPHNWVAEFNLAGYEESEGHVTNALTHLYRSENEHTGDAAFYVRIAVLEHRSGNLRNAIRHYDKALAVSQDDQMNAQLWANLGHAYSDLGDNAQALKCYRTAQRIRAVSAAVPALPPKMHWQGRWWNAILTYLRQRWQEP
jgi:protein O-mannosyl-transferase